MVTLAPQRSGKHDAQIRRLAWKVITRMSVPEIEELLRQDIPVVIARCARHELNRRQVSR